MRETSFAVEGKSSRFDSYRLIFSYIGLFIAFVGGIMLIPLLMLAFYHDEWMCWPAFVVPGVGCLVLGTMLAILLRPKETIHLGKHQDAVLLVAIWTVSIVIGAFPFYLAQFFDSTQEAVKMTFSESVFESMSGFTATGFTVFKNVLDAESAFSVATWCPHVFLFYRSVTQFVGGVGLVLVVASAVSDRYGMKLFYTEGHNDRLLPNLAKTAKLTFGIYSLIIALGTVALWFCGMDWFEALCHSTAGMATGGFSTRSSGFYYFETADFAGNGIFGYNPVGSEVTMIIIMILGATSFVVLYSALTLKWKKVIKDCEIRFTGFFLLLTILISSLTIMYSFSGVNGAGAVVEGLPFTTSLRYGAFQMVSCLTTTGFANCADIVSLGQTTVFLSILAMLIGGGMGSTAGAIKQYRVVIAFKELWWSIKYRLSPRRQMHPRIVYRAGEPKEVEPDDYRDNSLYILLYLFAIFILALACIPLPGINFMTAFYQVASGLSGTGNNVLDLFQYKMEQPLWSYNVFLWIMNFAMILGRLEILPIYFGFVRVIKDIFRRETV